MRLTQGLKVPSVSALLCVASFICQISIKILSNTYRFVLILIQQTRRILLYALRIKLRNKLFIFVFILFWTLHLLILPKVLKSYNDECFLPEKDLKKLRHIAKHVIQTFEQLNETYWIDFGTLLGAIRYRDILPHDYDVDISRLHYKDKNKESETGYEFHSNLVKFNISGNLMFASYKKFSADLFRYDVKEIDGVNYIREYWPHKESNFDRLKYLTAQTSFPLDMFIPTVTLPFMDIKVQAPRKYMELVKRRYPLTWWLSFPYKWKCWIPLFIRTPPNN